MLGPFTSLLPLFSTLFLLLGSADASPQFGDTLSRRRIAHLHLGHLHGSGPSEAELTRHPKPHAHNDHPIPEPLDSDVHRDRQSPSPSPEPHPSVAHTGSEVELARRQSSRQYRIFNQCPQGVNLYIGGNWDSWIPSNGVTTRSSSVGAGFFYTDANGGSAGGAGTRAGFLGPDWYYIVQDPNNFNVGMSIKPRDRSASNGFCPTIQCTTKNCAQAHQTPPTGFPASTSSAPVPPYYRCPTANTNYDITFCPTGAFPATTAKPITFNSNKNKCLDVANGKFENGTPVQLYDCNGTKAQQWMIRKGSTKVQLAGTNYCLDAGSWPRNGVGLKIWQCYDNLPAQQWYFTNDNRIALEGKGLCTDLENGSQHNWNKVQTWQCASGNTNQIWLSS